LQFHSAARLTAAPVSTPLRGFCTPLDPSGLPVSLPVGPPSESARFPLAPRCRSFSSMATDQCSWFVPLQLIESLIFPSSLAVRIWVAPSPAPSGCADLAFSGCPASASFGDSGNVSPGCPAAYVLQLYRRWIFESPRISHPSAALVVKFRVAPNLRSPTPPLMRPQVALSPASSGCQR